MSITSPTGIQVTVSTLGAQPLDADLTAVAALGAGPGVVEITAEDTYAIRALGVAGATSIPTRSDADTRYLAAAAQAADSAKLAGVTPAASPGFLALVDDANAADMRTTLGAADNAENTDGTICGAWNTGLAVAGTWSNGNLGSGAFRTRRTAGASSQTYSIVIPIPQRTTASRGRKPISLTIQYRVSTEVADDITFTAGYTVAPANGNALAAATSLGAVTYDTGHDTAGERGAIAQHTMTGTWASPVYLSGGALVIDVTCDDTTGGAAVFDLFFWQLNFSETLVD